MFKRQFTDLISDTDLTWKSVWFSKSNLSFGVPLGLRLNQGPFNYSPYNLGESLRPSVPQPLLSVKEAGSISCLAELLRLVLSLPRSLLPWPCFTSAEVLWPHHKPGLCSVAVRVLSVVNWLMKEQEFIVSCNWKNSPRYTWQRRVPKAQWCHQRLVFSFANSAFLCVGFILKQQSQWKENVPLPTVLPKVPEITFTGARWMYHSD